MCVWYIISTLSPLNSMDFCKHVDQHHDWAATWQNQQSDCAPSEDSDQPGHPRRLTVHPAKTQISLGIRPVWSESSRMPRLISLRWVHSHFVGFVMSWLMFSSIPCIFFSLPSQEYQQTQDGLVQPGHAMAGIRAKMGCNAWNDHFLSPHHQYRAHNQSKI